jgi:hypothetical protein
MATTNSEVVTRAINVEGCEINYDGIINKILDFSFVGNKELKVVFFDCDWFDNNNETQQNQFGMWKSNTMNDYEDMTCSSLHTRSSKCIICLIYAKR